MPTETLPRPFGNYLLTAALGEDALGRVYRARRLNGETGFVRVRILESPELSADAMLDAIEEGGEVHAFLKNSAIARGVDMDAVDGVPYIAWNEPSGRTLNVLLEKSRGLLRRIPVEHALLIGEKVAAALDHAYNTTIDGDRTLHGLVWPGFVVISDDGEIRLSGFGIAPAILPSIGRPRLSREIGPYLATEERAQGAVGKNSDVFSVGAILLELLTGEPPPDEPLLALKGAAGAPPPPIAPEIQAVLRMTLGSAENRYKSSGDLRRELGKLLFSGPYSPSTFNLAYFLNDLFRDEIEAESRARTREARLDAGSSPGAAPAPPALSPAPRRPREERAPAPAPRQVTAPTLHVAAPSRRGPLAIVGSIVVAAAVGGGILVLMRRPPGRPVSTAASRRPAAEPTPTLLPELQATPAGPTTAMTEEQFRDEVSRRLAFQVQKLEADMRSKAAALPPRSAAAAPFPTEVPAEREPAPTIAAILEPTAVLTAIPAEPERPLPTAVPVPTRVVVREGSLVALEEVDSPPRIATIVKPPYPPFALKARIGGIVVLRVLVSERGVPQQVDVIRGARAGLTEAATEAVKKWTFTPPLEAGVPVKSWITVPIPFEP
ncbi:MAG: TonB family protein [Thermoanaerobaculia bacterium]